MCVPREGSMLSLLRTHASLPSHINHLWLNRYAESLEDLEQDVNIVYRFYSTLDGSVKYVGRSDHPFDRESGHWNNFGQYSMHNRLEIQIVYVDFCYFTGRWRKLYSYREECRQYHKHCDTIVNLVHLAKPSEMLNTNCPVCGRWGSNLVERCYNRQRLSHN